VKAWIPDDSDLSILQGIRLSVSLQRDLNRAFSFAEYVPGVANTKEKAGLLYKDSTSLLVLLVDHFGELAVDEAMDLGLDLFGSV
jgi:hypothetical protein